MFIFCCFSIKISPFEIIPMRNSIPNPHQLWCYTSCARFFCIFAKLFWVIVNIELMTHHHFLCLAPNVPFRPFMVKCAALRLETIKILLFSLAKPAINSSKFIHYDGDGWNWMRSSQMFIVQCSWQHWKWDSINYKFFHCQCCCYITIICHPLIGMHKEIACTIANYLKLITIKPEHEL